MKGITSKTLIAATALQLLASCAALDEILPVTEAPSIENQRAAVGLSSLQDLDEIDTYIRLDNSPLRDQISDDLEAQALTTGTFEFSRLRVRFARQVIALEGTLQIANGQAEKLAASVHGDVILTFSGTQLIWLPRFDDLKVSEKNFSFEDQAYDVASNELEAHLLRRVNLEIADAVIVLGKNMVELSPIPLGDIEVGATLTNFQGMSSTGHHALGGVFTVAGSAILIESGITSIALDLEFIPNISACPSDLYVSRSAFTREIRNREPRGISRQWDENQADSHFYTEISGATRSTAIIHYWFADGRPVALEELAVEPSFRWRTWSSKRIDQSLGRNWEVIVVEKQTGCILHSKAIHTDPAIELSTGEQLSQHQAYEQYRSEFENRVSDFSILDQRPDIALIEIPRPFLTRVLHSSMKDIHIVVNFDVRDLPASTLAGSLRPFRLDELVCEEHECSSQRQCVSGFTQCARQRDSRDCTRCLFRNPLNNRCLNEGTDPICEAAKATQNVIFEARRANCMERETLATQQCQRLADQELSSCEIETASERSACVSAREAVQEFSNSSSFADVALKMNSGGALSSIFSDFAIEGNLENLRLKLGFSGVLDLSGSIRFAPRTNLGPLTDCMNAWQKSFDGKVVLPYQGNNMIGVIKHETATLETDWSGLVLSAPVSPTPLQAMFVENPRLLADCQIGLTVEKVANAIDGDASMYLDGEFPIEVQPLTSRIKLAEASVAYGEQVYRSEAELSDTHLIYDIQN